jgi:hypothetical protein
MMYQSTVCNYYVMWPQFQLVIRKLEKNNRIVRDCGRENHTKAY